ncbi:MAG: HEAT repeat domain-containing protein [Myxococcaceae bacterium]|nr:HEAT repeat domain-containing protein [Myxococcaceae bacterium]
MNDAIDELGQQLSSDDPYERETSALELAELEAPEAAPFLVRALEDEEEAVRRWAVYGLAKLGFQEHAPALRHALEKDPAPSVRVQAAFGLARLGERGALERLTAFLGGPTLNVRRDAAEVLFSHPEPARLRPLLRPLLTARDERARAWAAAVLHSQGDPEAFQSWQEALVSPEGRQDAVLAAPLMQDARSTREVLRLLVELPPEELEAAESEEPSLQELLADSLRMSSVNLLLGGAEKDEALRADLLVLLGRHQHLIPELVEDIVEAISQRPPEKLGAELAELLFEQERQERARLFTLIAPLFPEAALPTLVELRAQDREEVLQAVVQAAREAGGEDPGLVALTRALRATPYASRFEGLPTVPSRRRRAPRQEDANAAARTLPEMPAISPDSEASLTEEMELPNDDDVSGSTTQETDLPEEEFEEEEEFDGEFEDEEEWSPPVPPVAEAVAQRALVLGGLLRRMSMEERLARGRDPAAMEELLRLQKWMDEEGLFATLGVTGMELFEVEPGAWSEEDRVSISWSTEELQLLLWALKQCKLPPQELRSEAAPLLERLPLLKDPQPFLESTERRPIEEVSAQLDRWEVLLECARYESLARGIAADPTLAEGDEELEILLESAEEVGFDRRGVASKQGRAQCAVQGLRHWSRHLVTELQEGGLLPGTPGEGLIFQGKRLAELEEPALGTLLSLAHARFQTLEWLTEGDVALPEGEDEVG